MSSREPPHTGKTVQGDEMPRPAWSRLLPALLLLGGLAASFLAWRDWRSAVVVVEWSTASELDTVGFNLYRAEQANGEYTKINAAVIPSAGDALTGSDYQYEDRDVRAGQTYYYELEDVTPAGSGERYGPIIVEARGQIGSAAVAAVLLLGGAILAWGWRIPPQPPDAEKKPHLSP